MIENYSIYPKTKRNFFFRLSLTAQLIIINIIAYFAGFFLTYAYGEKFLLDYVALTPALILSGESLWTILTSMFMHGSFFHLFANMFSLFFIGNFLEKLIGRKRFFWVYIISGILGSAFFVSSAFLFGDLSIPAVGASGAIFGLLGVLAVLVPYSRVYLIAGPLILIILDVVCSIIFPGASNLISSLITALIFIMLFSLLSFRYRKIAIPIELPMWLLPIIAIVPLIIISYFLPLPIGNSAHVGGLVAGLLYGFYLRQKFPNKTKKISQIFR